MFTFSIFSNLAAMEIKFCTLFRINKQPSENYSEVQMLQNSCTRNGTCFLQGIYQNSKCFCHCHFGFSSEMCVFPSHERLPLQLMPCLAAPSAGEGQRPQMVQDGSSWLISQLDGPSWMVQCGCSWLHDLGWLIPAVWSRLDSPSWMITTGWSRLEVPSWIVPAGWFRLNALSWMVPLDGGCGVRLGDGPTGWRMWGEIGTVQSLAGAGCACLEQLCPDFSWGTLTALSVHGAQFRIQNANGVDNMKMFWFFAESCLS